MARIRSVHPGLATDARFVVLSDAAQIFYVLLLTVADDAGVFRWEPLELRMQLRPASQAPVEPLLDELAAGNFLRRFEAGGHAYGAVRNFRRYQSPKMPTRRHPLPENLFPYVGLEPGTLTLVPKNRKKKAKQKQAVDDRLPQPFGSDGEAMGNPFPTERDMERERDKEKDKEKTEREPRGTVSARAREAEPPAAPPRPSPKILKKVQEGQAEPAQSPNEIPEGWLAEAEAARDEADLPPVNLTLEWLKFATRADGPVELRRWVEWSLRAWVSREPQHRANGNGGFGPAADDMPEVPWAARMRQWQRSGWWHPNFGPKPGETGCFVPVKFLAEAAE